MSAKNGELKIPVGPEDHIQGRQDAPVTLVEYGDYQCPHCGRAYPVVKRVQKRLGTSLRFVFRNFPLAEAHPFATAAAEIAEAAGLQNRFWPMHDTLFEHQEALAPANLLLYAQNLHLDIAQLQEALESPAIAKRVRGDFMGGVRSGVNGTPTFFVNGLRFDGDWTDENEFTHALETLTKAG